jgi:hypothetical protein
MNIAQSLKEKNRIAGRINKLQKKVEDYNVKEINEVKDFDSLELLKELQTEWAYLIDIKSRLARANIGICEKLVRLAEAKSELSFWSCFHNAGQAAETYLHRYNDGEKIVSEQRTKVSLITSKEVTDHQERVQTMIDTLQDEIDIYNGTTQI